VKLRLAALVPLILLAACRHSGDIMEGQKGVLAFRDACPIAGIPTGTGDITLFNPAGSTDARAIDVTAVMTNLRSTCQAVGDDYVSTVQFDVVAQRNIVGPARQVVLPYFDVILQGGQTVAAKQLGSAVLVFANGAPRAQVRVHASARVNRAAAELPDEVRRELTRERKPGELEAAIDPLSDPAIRTAVAQATFEHLVGFQLTEDQLRYNATR